jgi:hypothetical protein
MYSASLIGAIFHTIPPPPGDSRRPSTHETQSDVAAVLESLLQHNPSVGRRQVPVVGRSSFESLGGVLKWMGEFLSVDDGPPAPIFWGRVPLEALIRYFRMSANKPGKEEYLDLATPLRRFGTAGSRIEADCARLAAAAATTTTTVGAAIIDRGDESPGNFPNDFGGKVQHASTKDVEFGLHALQVLWVLLDRLNSNGTIAETEIACALVKEPSNPIGLKCFDHANAAELLDSMKELRRLLHSSSLPWAINLSLGTHVGPHNGQSPIEEYVAKLAPPNRGRFLVAAAGNEGLSGIAGRRELVANIRDYLKVRVGPNTPAEVFVELWWEEPDAGAGMVIEVMPSDANGTQLLTAPLRITAATAGSSLAVNHPGFGGNAVQTLFHIKAHNNMSCAAFALSSNGGSLPVLDLEIAMEASADVVVNGWIVVCDDTLTSFVEASNEGTIAVPATAPDAVCVAGVESTGQPWARSARGPAANYAFGKASTAGAPHLAYLVAPGFSGADGTSFAAPRVTADAASALKDPTRRANCTNPSTLALEVLPSVAGGPRRWNPRTGYGERST